MKNDLKVIREMTMFIRFSYHFFSIIWHFHAVFLFLIALIVNIAAVITYSEKIPFGDALYFSFIADLTIGYASDLI